MVAKSIAKMYTNIHKPTDYNQQYKKNEVVLCRSHQTPQRRMVDLVCHLLETIINEEKKRQGSKTRQPSSGETTWSTNTGVTRSGRGQRKTG